MGTNFKKKRIEDKKYFDWVKTQKCIITEYEGELIIPHHVYGGGMSGKCDDKDSVPLKFGYHGANESNISVHKLNREPFEKHHGIEFAKEIKRLNEKYEDEGNKLKT